VTSKPNKKVAASLANSRPAKETTLNPNHDNTLSDGASQRHAEIKAQLQQDIVTVRAIPSKYSFPGTMAPEPVMAHWYHSPICLSWIQENMEYAEARPNDRDWYYLKPKGASK
jgi:hypothetical protein